MDPWLETADLEELGICMTLDAESTSKRRFFSENALTKFVVLPVSAEAAFLTLLIFTLIDTL